MKLSTFIARRYLFSKKRQNVINIISTISVIGVFIGTTALIVIMSVFNGIELLLQESSESFTPDIVITPNSGKFFRMSDSLYTSIKNMPDIVDCYQVIEEKCLAKHGGKMQPVTIKGVSSDYIRNTGLSNNIRGGIIKKEDNVIIGSGVAIMLELYMFETDSLMCYFPNRKSSLSNMSSLRSIKLRPTSIISVQQDIDSEYIITNIPTAQKLFELSREYSKIEIWLYPVSRPLHQKADAQTIQIVKAKISHLLQNSYTIKDKFEINKIYYSMMRTEKLSVFLILLFILIVASFNIVGSISMLILDKKEDMITLKSMGMTKKQIISIFRQEGFMITIIGVLIGTLFGVLLVFLQQEYGFLTMGNGNYITSFYPVDLVLSDVLTIVAAILLIGWFAALLPVRYLIKRIDIFNSNKN